jgi:8-oxo-dGTP pyrophosphatase MutT (NUDIX family)
VDENEPLDQAAARELQEETSVDPSNVPFIQVSPRCITLPSTDLLDNSYIISPY